MSKADILRAILSDIEEDGGNKRKCDMPMYEDEEQAIEAFARIAHLKRGDRVYFNRTMPAVFMDWGIERGTAHLVFYYKEKRTLVGVETPVGTITLHPFYDELES